MLSREPLVGIPAGRKRAYPHELSGGLRQRVRIAIALSGRPQILLCDEPTTALDVTLQSQIIALLARLRSELDLSVVFVTHDFGVAAEISDRIAVMYVGEIVELGSAEDVLRSPRHPYTAGLIGALPSFYGCPRALVSIPGVPPDPLLPLPPGCTFAPRCAFARVDCRAGAYPLLPSGDERWSGCIHHAEFAHAEATA
jgi:oligopeptide/dipeptide ABC transporter ATP-binding protein